MAAKSTSKDTSHAETPAELAQDLKRLIQDAEKMLVNSASEQVDETVEELRKQLREKIDHLRSAYEAAEGRVLSVATEADKRIRKNPYESVGLAVGIGVIIGLLLRK